MEEDTIRAKDRGWLHKQICEARETIKDARRPLP
jgi:hypothetical protein